MSAIKKLAGQTAIYGLSSIVGRLLNYLLVPIYTRVFAPGEYGEVTEMYAYVSFLNIVFTYGLETAFFRYYQSEENKLKVYSTSLISIVISSLAFAGTLILLSSPIANAISGSERPSPLSSQYISWFACILAADAVTAIPFARLRQENKAFRFVTLRLINIAINIGLNLFFLVYCPSQLKHDPSSWVAGIYNPSLGVGYVFISNLVASVFTLIMLLPYMLGISLSFDKALWRKMILYALPLMVAGFAGMINETFDRIMLPRLVADKSTALEQLGIYGACYKLSIIMTLFIQTFRFAAEPFFFSHAAKENAREIYSRVMHYFVLTCSFIFLSVMLMMDVVKDFIGEDYHSGLKVVPILLLANLCLGVFYNLSIWYKLSGKSYWGAWLSLIGAGITILLNFILIPLMGYLGAAWATLLCYAAMMIISYVIGQKHYTVNYNLKSFAYYLSCALFIFFASHVIRTRFDISANWMLTLNVILIVLFIVVIILSETGKNSYLRVLLFRKKKDEN